MYCMYLHTVCDLWYYKSVYYLIFNFLKKMQLKTNYCIRTNWVLWCRIYNYHIICSKSNISPNFFFLNSIFKQSRVQIIKLVICLSRGLEVLPLTRRTNAKQNWHTRELKKSPSCYPYLNHLISMHA